MRLPFASPSTVVSSPPRSPLARVEDRLFPGWRPASAHPGERRPLLWRHGTAPAALLQHRQHDYFSLPFSPPQTPRHPIVRRLGAAARRVREEADEVRDHAEAGCMRMLFRVATWWLWRRWRR